ncbi:MAG: hypothetical protein Q4B50_03825 [Bacillota bacterium]|nr:hypothetical protein [Bacillota bacterium]
MPINRGRKTAALFCLLLFLLLSISLPSAAEEPVETSGDFYIYKDSITSAELQIPRELVQGEIINMRDYSIVPFRKQGGETDFLFFCAADNYNTEQVQEIRRTLDEGEFPRSDVDNSLFSKEQVAEMFACEEEAVFMQEIGPREFFMAEELLDVGDGETLSLSHICRVENGYMYYFMFIGELEGESYALVEQIILSMKYPEAPEEKGIPFVLLPLLLLSLSYVLPLLLCLLPTFLYRFQIAKNPISPGKAICFVIVQMVIVLLILLAVDYFFFREFRLPIALLLLLPINYIILNKGYQPPEEAAPEGKPEEKAVSPAPLEEQPHVQLLSGEQPEEE